MTAVEKYFTGEKAESYLFLAMGIMSIILAVYFFFTLKQSFWKGVAVPFLLVAILEIIVGYTIVTRSPKDIVRVENILQNNKQHIQTEEIPRMEKVLQNFVVFRYIEIALIILGILLMYATPAASFWKGLGLGLFMQASIVLTLDFFAESRGKIYIEYLQNIK